MVVRPRLELPLKCQPFNRIRAAAHLELVLMPHKVYCSQGIRYVLVGLGVGLTLSLGKPSFHAFNSERIAKFRH